MNNNTSTEILYRHESFYVKVSTITQYPALGIEGKVWTESIQYTQAVFSSFAKASEYVTENLLEKTLGVAQRYWTESQLKELNESA